MEKLYTSKAFLKMAGGRMHTPHPTSLYPPKAISYRNHQKSLAYFSHLAPLILFFLLKGRVKRGNHGTMLPLPPKYAPGSANTIQRFRKYTVKSENLYCAHSILLKIRRNQGSGVRTEGGWGVISPPIDDLETTKNFSF